MQRSGTNKAYLGDGAYVTFDGYGLMLTTENGISVTNEVYLEPAVYEALVMFVDGLRRAGEVNDAAEVSDGK